jgi:hypothetical protein
VRIRAFYRSRRPAAEDTPPERQVFTFPVEVLDERDPSATLKKAKRISAHTSFIKVGRCRGRTLVSIVKASQPSTTIRTLEQIDQSVRAMPTLRRLLQGGTSDSLKTFRVSLVHNFPAVQFAVAELLATGILYTRGGDVSPFPQDKIVP